MAEATPDTQSVTREQPVPSWALALAAIALLSMATQIKLPFAGGRLALADITLAAAFAGLFLSLWRGRLSLRYPVSLALALGLYALTGVLGRSGPGAAIETAQRIEQFFCAYLLFAFVFAHRPRWLPRLLLAGVAINLLVAAIQWGTHGFGSSLAPADVLDLRLGFGGAVTGLFRSRASLSFYLAAVLVLAQPYWFAWARSSGRLLGVLLGTVLVLTFMAHGQLLVIACTVLILAGFFQGRRAAVVNIAAVAVLAFTLPWGGDGIRARTVLETLSPASTQANREGVLKTRHLDAIAAMRMARRRPFLGVGAGRYQEFIGRCYGELPNPNYNDIDTDTQSGLGILFSTVGFPAGALLLLVFVAALCRGIRLFPAGGEVGPLLLGGSSALAVFSLGMLVSDPFVNGLSWFLALSLASVYAGSAGNGGLRLDWKGILLVGAGYAVLIALILVIPKNRDPLAGQRPQTVAVARPETTTTAPAPASETTTQRAMNAGAIDFFKVIDAGDAKTIAKPMVKGTDSQAGNQTILEIPDLAGTPPEGEEPDMKYGGAHFEIAIPANIECKIWVRVWWDGSCGNTLGVKLGEDGRAVTVGNDGTFHAWHWLEVPRVYALEEGSHNLYILNREDGIRLDQILITNDMEYFPQGIEEE